MLSYPIPSNEPSRLAAVNATDGLGHAPNARLDEITSELAAAFGCPTALVSVVGDTRQVFRSRYGFDACETTREGSICAQLIMDRDLAVICDTHTESRFRDLAAVSEPPHVRFYAGAPVVLGGGFRAGSLCVLDVVPRNAPEPEKLALLSARAEEVGAIIAASTPHPPSPHATAQDIFAHPPRVQDPSTIAANMAEAPMSATADDPADPAEQARRAFLNLVGHELRTPLTVLLGYARILEQRIEMEPDKTMTGAIRRVGDHLNAVVNSVLNYSDLGSGERLLDEQVRDIRPFLHGCIDLVSPSVAIEGKSLELMIGDVPAAIQIDPAQIQLVIFSLLKNAVGYGGATVRLTAHTAPDGHLVISVGDDGAPISADGAETMFEPFAQMGEIRHHGETGLGLGLALSRRIVDMHGGKMALRRSGGFNCFTVTLPKWRLCDQPVG